MAKRITFTLLLLTVFTGRAHVLNTEAHARIDDGCVATENLVLGGIDNDEFVNLCFNG